MKSNYQVIIKTRPICMFQYVSYHIPTHTSKARLVIGN